jgi:hypothetical protein
MYLLYASPRYLTAAGGAGALEIAIWWGSIRNVGTLGKIE